MNLSLSSREQYDDITHLTMGSGSDLANAGLISTSSVQLKEDGYELTLLGHLKRMVLCVVCPLHWNQFPP